MEPTLITLVVCLGVSLLLAVDHIGRLTVQITKLEATQGAEARAIKIARIPEMRVRPVRPRYVPANPLDTGEMRAITAPVDEPAYHCDGRRAFFDGEGKLVRPFENRVTPRQRAARLAGRM